MYRRIHGRLLFYALTLTGLFVAGVLILGSFLSHPGPGNNESWYLFMLTFPPFMAVSGIAALGLRRLLGFPWWLGAGLLAYPAMAFLTLSPEMRRYLMDSEMRARMAYESVGEFTGLHLFSLVLTLACVLASLFFLSDPDRSER